MMRMKKMSEIILISTPYNSGNYFYKLWKEFSKEPDPWKKPDIPRPWDEDDEQEEED